ncbi:hypothetical protein HY357_00560 [Candidatus Roizmanbacteria bacterium]|nr:hypothetical protein [Candidatus Roizmanbacteria bacterium]
MAISPILENQAKDEVHRDCEQLKKGLGIDYLPLFFSYIGAFPEYLRYLTDQLIPNVSNPKFNGLVRDTAIQINSLIKTSLNKSEEIQDWLSRYKNTPSFYNFQKDLDRIFTINLKLVFIFVALREALKGWAVAAKKIPESVADNNRSEQIKSLSQEIFMYEDYSTYSSDTRSNLEFQQQGLARTQPKMLEKDLLPRYISLCQLEFRQQMKKEEFLILRVGIEKLILSSLPLLPEKIISPINLFYSLTDKYADFPDLLYLMSEHFPTFAVQKMLFSGFMKHT